MSEHDKVRLRVVELADGLGGRVLGRLLAGMGHDVVRIAPPEATARSIVVDADKVRVPLDRDDAASLAVALEGADVVILDVDPARSVAWTASELHAARPDLIVVSINGFGDDPELADLPADSGLAEAYGGLASVIGHAGGPPTVLGGDQAAHAAGFTGLLGLMLSVASKRAGGSGALVEVALSDVVAFLDWKSDAALDAGADLPDRHDRAHPWTLFPATDGWVGVILTPAEWPALVELVGDPRLDRDGVQPTAALRDVDHWRPIVGAWVADRTQQDVYLAAQALGLPFGYAAGIDDLLDCEQYRARGFLTEDDGGALRIAAPWLSEHLSWRFGPTQDVDSVPPASSTGITMSTDVDPATPLADMVVLDLGAITAGAAVGRLLADYGATVIKVESPSRPDPFRRWATGGRFVDSGTSPLFDCNNAGKFGVGLDLKDPADREEFYGLVEQADVVIENFRVGVTERLGIDAATLRERNPDLVYLTLSSQGSVGPEARFGSYGSTLDLISGAAVATDPERPIWSSGRVNYPDQVVSLIGAALVVTCWATGVRGEHIDLAQRELMTWTLADRLVVARSGHSEPSNRGTDGMFEAADGEWVLVRPLDAAAQEACDALTEGDPATWCRARPAAEASAMLRDEGVPAVVVRNARQRAEDPGLVRRGVVIETPRGRRKGVPCRVDTLTVRPYRTAPEVGEHDTEVRSTPLRQLAESDR